MFRKFTAILTTITFLVSFVFGQPLLAVTERNRELKDFKKIFDSFVLPATMGRITDSSTGKSGNSETRISCSPVVINIQDLHCHPEVQKNISNILSSLDNKYHLKKIYIEGAAGPIDTSWLTQVNDKGLKEKILEALINGGKLTGAEYYSAISGRPDLLYGIDDRKLHTDNIMRLSNIENKQAEIMDKFDELSPNLEVLKERYYNSKNKKLDSLVLSYKNGDIAPQKYYSSLKDYSKKLDIDITKFKNVAEFSKSLEQANSLNYSKITREMQGYLALLKAKLPYSAFNLLAANTVNFTQANQLYVYLSRISKDYNSSYTADFPNLKKFFDYLDSSRNLNPNVLIKEEEKLVNEIRFRLAAGSSERDIVFLIDFSRLLKDYLSYKISAQDYKYVEENLPKFNLLWAQYSGSDSLAELQPYIALLGEFYSVNIKRNDCLLGNCQIKQTGDKGQGAGVSQTNSENILENTSDVVVMITGGFHTAGISELMKEKNIPYVVITPNVTQDAAPAEKTYAEFLKFEGKLLASLPQTIGFLPQNMQSRPVSRSLSTLSSIGLSSGRLNSLQLILLSMLGIHDRAAMAAVDIINEIKNGNSTIAQANAELDALFSVESKEKIALAPTKDGGYELTSVYVKNGETVTEIRQYDKDGHLLDLDKNSVKTQEKGIKKPLNIQETAVDRGWNISKVKIDEAFKKSLQPAWKTKLPKYLLLAGFETLLLGAVISYVPASGLLRTAIIGGITLAFVSAHILGDIREYNKGHITKQDIVKRFSIRLGAAAVSVFLPFELINSPLLAGLTSLLLHGGWNALSARKNLPALSLGGDANKSNPATVRTASHLYEGRNGISIISDDKAQEIAPFIEEFVFSSEFESVVFKIAKNKVNVGDLSGVEVTYFAQGSNKMVYKLTLYTKDRRSINVMFALKIEKENKAISQHEILDLQWLSIGKGSTLSLTPIFGCTFKFKDGKEAYIEQFIEGETPDQLRAAGKLSKEIKKNIVTKLISVGIVLGGLFPKDIHGGNFIVNNGNSVMVDLGIKRFELSKAVENNYYTAMLEYLFLVVLHYDDESGDNSYILQAFDDAIVNTQSVFGNGVLRKQRTMADVKKDLEQMLEKSRLYLSNIDNVQIASLRETLKASPYFRAYCDKNTIDEAQQDDLVLKKIEIIKRMLENRPGLVLSPTSTIASGSEIAVAGNVGLVKSGAYDWVILQPDAVLEVTAIDSVIIDGSGKVNDSHIGDQSGKHIVTNNSKEPVRVGFIPKNNHPAFIGLGSFFTLPFAAGQVVALSLGDNSFGATGTENIPAGSEGITHSVKVVMEQTQGIPSLRLITSENEQVLEQGQNYEYLGVTYALEENGSNLKIYNHGSLKAWRVINKSGVGTAEIAGSGVKQIESGQKLYLLGWLNQYAEYKMDDSSGLKLAFWSVVERMTKGWIAVLGESLGLGAACAVLSTNALSLGAITFVFAALHIITDKKEGKPAKEIGANFVKRFGASLAVVFLPFFLVTSSVSMPAAIFTSFILHQFYNALIADKRFNLPTLAIALKWGMSGGATVKTGKPDVKEKVSIATLLNQYHAGKQAPQNVEILKFQVEDDILAEYKLIKPSFYNITSFVPPGKKTQVIAARVEMVDSEKSYTMFFKKEGLIWVRIQGSPVLELQDPFSAIIDGQLVVGGVELQWGIPWEGKERIENWRTVLYKVEGELQDQQGKKQERIWEGPWGMKDVRFLDMKDGRILVMIRPQGGKAGPGKIGYLIVNDIKELTPEKIQKAPLIYLWPEEEWGGANQLQLLDDGTVGVVAHIAQYDKAGDRAYYPMAFHFDANTGDTGPLEIILERSQIDKYGATAITAYQAGEIDINQFRKEYKNKYRLINEVLARNGIDVKDSSSITQERLAKVFNQLISIPNLIELLAGNEGLSEVREGNIDNEAIFGNKQKMGKIFSLSLNMAKRPDLFNVSFPGALIRNGDGTADLYGGAGDILSYHAEKIPDPKSWKENIIPKEKISSESIEVENPINESGAFGFVFGALALSLTLALNLAGVHDIIAQFAVNAAVFTFLNISFGFIHKNVYKKTNEEWSNTGKAGLKEKTFFSVAAELVHSPNLISGLGFFFVFNSGFDTAKLLVALVFSGIALLCYMYGSTALHQYYNAHIAPHFGLPALSLRSKAGLPNAELVDGNQIAIPQIVLDQLNITYKKNNVILVPLKPYGAYKTGRILVFSEMGYRRLTDKLASKEPFVYIPINNKMDLFDAFDIELYKEGDSKLAELDEATLRKMTERGALGTSFTCELKGNYIELVPVVTQAVLSALSVGFEEFLTASGIGLTKLLSEISVDMAHIFTGENNRYIVFGYENEIAELKTAFGNDVEVRVSNSPEVFKRDGRGEVCGIPAFLAKKGQYGRKVLYIHKGFLSALAARPELIDTFAQEELAELDALYKPEFFDASVKAYKDYHTVHPHNDALIKLAKDVMTLVLSPRADTINSNGALKNEFILGDNIHINHITPASGNEEIDRFLITLFTDYSDAFREGVIRESYFKVRGHMVANAVSDINIFSGVAEILEGAILKTEGNPGQFLAKVRDNILYRKTRDINPDLRYIRVLGTGKTSVVVLVEDLRDHKKKALKVVKHYGNIFKNEKAVMADLRDKKIPGLVQALDIYDDAILMEYLPGILLGQYLRENKEIPLSARIMMRQFARNMARNGYLMADVTEESVFIDAGGKITFIDTALYKKTADISEQELFKRNVDEIVEGIESGTGVHLDISGAAEPSQSSSSFYGTDAAGLITDKRDIVNELETDPSMTGLFKMIQIGGTELDKYLALELAASYYMSFHMKQAIEAHGWDALTSDNKLIEILSRAAIAREDAAGAYKNDPEKLLQRLGEIKKLLNARKKLAEAGIKNVRNDDFAWINIIIAVNINSLNIKGVKMKEGVSLGQVEKYITEASNARAELTGIGTEFGPDKLDEALEVFRKIRGSPLLQAAFKILYYHPEVSALAVELRALEERIDNLSQDKIESAGDVAVYRYINSFHVTIIAAALAVLGLAFNVLGVPDNLISLMLSSLPIFGAILLLKLSAWATQVTGKRAGPNADAFLSSAKVDQSVSFFDVENNTLKVNPGVHNLLTHMPIWLQNTILYGLGIAGHETYHMQHPEQKGINAELHAYGLTQILPAVIGAGLAILLGFTGIWVIAGVFIITGTVGLINETRGLTRLNNNEPILEKTENTWESEYVLNPAALNRNQQLVMAYRAHGTWWKDNKDYKHVSTIGLASRNADGGITRYKYPILVPELPSEFPIDGIGDPKYGFGVEDPRLMEIGGDIYMSYTAFDGQLPRIAFARISKKDFDKGYFYKDQYGKGININDIDQFGNVISNDTLRINRNWQYLGNIPFLSNKDGYLQQDPKDPEGEVIMFHRPSGYDGLGDSTKASSYFMRFKNMRQFLAFLKEMEKYEARPAIAGENKADKLWKIVTGTGDESISVGEGEDRVKLRGQLFMGPRAKGWWDSFKVGGGAPALLTMLGWVHVYHGVHYPDTGREYSLGIVITSRKDPTKIIWRSKKPILKPELPWEREGWEGVGAVVFSCGAAPASGDSSNSRPLGLSEKILVPYGAADAAIGLSEGSLLDLVPLWVIARILFENTVLAFFKILLNIPAALVKYIAGLVIVKKDSTTNKTTAAGVADTKLMIGAMPIAFDKSKLKDGRIDVVYNPSDNPELPGLLKNPGRIFIHYSYDGSGVSQSVEMKKNSEGMWSVPLNDTRGHNRMDFVFSDEKEAKDPVKYRTYLDVNSDGMPVLFREAHSHIAIGLDQKNTDLLPALLSGGMEEGAVIMCRNNEKTLELLKRYPQFHGLAWATLSDAPSKASQNMPNESSINAIVSLLKDNPAIVGIKLHPTIDKVTVNDKKVKDLLQAISDIQSPSGRPYVALVHSAAEYCEPSQFEELAVKFPKINFILAHGYIDNDAVRRQQAIELAMKFDNVYLETSWLPGDIIIDAVKKAGAKKVLFGSDTQSMNHYDLEGYNYGGLIDYLRKELSPEDFSLVMSGNSERLFGFGADREINTPRNIPGVPAIPARAYNAYTQQVNNDMQDIPKESGYIPEGAFKPTGAKGPVVYYPLASTDISAAFSVAEGAEEVFLTGQEPFGDPESIELGKAKEKDHPEILEKDAEGRAYALKSNLMKMVSQFGGIGYFILRGIQSQLGDVQVLGIYYFNLNAAGEAKFVFAKEEINELSGAVVVFKDNKTGKIKKCWYMRLNIPVGKPDQKTADYIGAYKKFISRLKFNTLLFKGAMVLDTSRVTACLDACLGNSRTTNPGAVVVTDQTIAGKDTYAIWQKGKEPRKLPIKFKFGYSEKEDKYVYYGPLGNLLPLSSQNEAVASTEHIITAAEDEAVLAATASVKPHNFVKRWILGRFEHKGVLAGKTCIIAAFDMDRNTTNNDIRQLTKNGLNAVGVDFINADQLKTKKIKKGVFEEFTAEESSAENWERRVPHIAVTIGHPGQLQSTAVQQLKIWVEKTGSAGVMIYVQDPGVAITPELCAEVFHQLVKNIATDRTDEAQRNFSHQLSEFGNLPNSGQQLTPDILSIGDSVNLAEGLNAPIYNMSNTLVVASKANSTLIANSRVDFTVEANKLLSQNMSGLESAYTTKAVTSVAMQRMFLTIAVSLKERSFSTLYEYVEELKQGDSFSGSALMSSVRLDDENVPESGFSEFAAMVRKVKKDFTVKFAKNIAVNSKEDLVNLKDNALNTLSKEIYDDLHINFSGFNYNISADDLKAKLLEFALSIHTAYPKARIYITLPQQFERIKDVLSQVPNFVVNPREITTPLELNTLLNSHQDVTDIVIDSKYEWLRDVVNGDAVRKLLKKSFAPKDKFAYGHNKGFKMFESLAKEALKIDEKEFVQLCQTAFNCCGKNSGPELAAEISKALNGRAFNSGELSRAKQDIERSIERYNAVENDRDKDEAFAAIRGEFAGVIKAVLKERLKLSSQVEFADSRDEANFLVLMLAAYKNESTRNIPKLISEGRYDPKLSSALDKVNTKTLVGQLAILMSSQGQDVQSFIEKGNIEINGVTLTLTLDDMISILLVSKEVKSLSTMLKNNAMPVLDTATVLAINAAG